MPVGRHPVVPHHRALVVGGTQVVPARVHLGHDARPLPPRVGDAEEGAVGGVELGVVHRLGQVRSADQRHQVAFGGGPAARDALPQRHPVEARAPDRAVVELGDQQGDIAAAVLYRLGDERADVAQAGHGPGRVGDGASKRHESDPVGPEPFHRHPAGAHDPHVARAPHAHVLGDEDVDLIEARALQPVSPHRDRPGQQALRPRVEQRRHRPLIRGDRAGVDHVNAGQDPLPPAARPDQVIEPAAAHAALDRLRPANHSELLTKHSVEPFPIIDRCDWHAHRMSPPTDKTPAPVQRRAKPDPPAGAAAVRPGRRRRTSCCYRGRPPVAYASDRISGPCRLRHRQDRRPVTYASDSAYWCRWRR